MPAPRLPHRGTGFLPSPAPMLAPLLTLALLCAPSRAARDFVGEGLLAKGRPRMAAQRFSEVLQQRPDDADVRLARARAWADLGWCDKAIPEFEATRATDAWNADGALALSDCYADWWRRDDAMEVLEEALVLTDDGPGTRTRLAWEALMAGDRVTFDAQLEALMDDDPDSTASLLLLGAAAWADGDTVAMTWHLDALRALQPKVPKADLLEAWSWLELGEPAAAVDLLTGPARLVRRRLPEVSAWMMESNRRLGDERIVRNMLDQRTKEEEYPPARLALRLRARADLDGVASVRREAAALVAAWPMEPEAVATAWYVATLDGDAAAAQHLAERYALLVPPGRMPLQRLLPLVPSDTSSSPAPEHPR